MSWVINLSGSKDFVKEELTVARNQIETALDVLDHAPGPLVNVSVSGSAYINPQPGASGIGASFNVSSYWPDPPPPQPTEVVNEEAPVAA
jgi:hypothetical protein